MDRCGVSHAKYTCTYGKTSLKASKYMKTFRYHPLPDSQSNQSVFDFTDQAIIPNALYLHVVPTLTLR